MRQIFKRSNKIKMTQSANNYRLGIDIGSTTAKIIIFNNKGAIVFNQYGKHNTFIYQVLTQALKNAQEKLGDISVSCAITGTAGMGVSERNNIKFVQEVIAATDVVEAKYPEVSTLIDIGGEDTKMIFFQKGKSPDIRMNGNCAGGTGAFIEQMATLLNVKIEEMMRSFRQNRYSKSSCPKSRKSGYRIKHFPCCWHSNTQHFVERF